MTELKPSKSVDTGEVKPVSPDNVPSIDSSVMGRQRMISIINPLLESGLVDGKKVIYKRDLVNILRGSRLDIFQAEEEGWYDIEDEYREAGWDVERNSGVDKDGQSTGDGITYTFRPKATE